MKRLVASAPLLLILLLGFALRLFRLGAASLWYDETVSVWLARQDLAEITRHTAGDIHPPLYYYLLHFWGQFAGWTEFAVAFFSLLFGVLLIALVYRLGRDWIGARAGAFAALLVAFSPYNVWYSQEVRMYTLGAVLGLASVYFGVHALADRGPRGSGEAGKGAPVRGPWTAVVLYLLVTAAGLYTLYYFLFLIAFENLAALAWITRQWRVAGGQGADGEPRRGNRVVGGQPSAVSLGRLRSAVLLWLGSQLAVVLLYLPWLPVAVRQATDPPVPPWRGYTPLVDIFGQSFGALSFGQSVDLARVWPLLLVPALLIVVALVRVRRRAAAWGLLGYTLVPVALIAAFSLWKPLFHVRYVFTYSPAFYLLLGLGLAELRPPRRQESKEGFIYLVALAARLLLLLLVIAGSALSLRNFWYDPQYATDDLRSAVQHLAENWRPGDVVLVNAGYAYTALVYFDAPVAGRERLPAYAPGPEDAGAGARVLMTGSIDGAPSLGWGDPASDFFSTTAAETTAALDRVFAAHPRVWQFRIYDTVVDPGGVIRKYLDDHATVIDETVYAGEANARVIGYLTLREPSTRPPASARALNANLAGRMTLVAVEAPAGPRRAGDDYAVVLYWQPQQTLDVNYHTSVQITGEGDRKIAQFDEMPLGNALPATRWQPGRVYREPVRLTLDPQAAPGAYTVRAILYNPNTGEPVGEPVAIATIVIE